MPKFDVLARDNDVKQRTATLTVTEDCNLRCRYCYEPNKSRDHYMSFETAKNTILKIMNADDGFEMVEFDFFGGEPFLAFDLIRNLVDWFHTQKWNKKHRFFLGTNGTILTDEMRIWLELNKHCVVVGVSLDGSKIAHDINRSNSYDQVMKNIPFFMKHWPNQPVKMTISAETIPYVADSIIDLEEKGIPFSANVVFEDIWGTPEQKPNLLDIYSRQLDRLIDYYLEHSNLYPARIISIKPEYITKEFRGFQKNGEDCVRWCGAGHEMIVIDVDGSVSPCHRFSKWITGKEPPKDLVNYQNKWKPEKCANCKLISVCPTCAGFNWQVNGDSGIRTTFHCDAFKLEVLASAKLQALKYIKMGSYSPLLSEDDAHETKLQLDGILELLSEGI